MTIFDDIKLDNIDPEDFGDTLLKLEKSFGAKFADNSFKDAKTFGDICDIVGSQINLSDKVDCTTQQAFYKVRKAISLTYSVAEKNIKPESNLEDFFPRQNRIQNVKNFQQNLGINVDLLSMKTWLAWTILIGFTLSLIAFFFSWKIAIIGLTFFSLFSWTISKFSKEIDITTVGELAEKISREHYSQARRQVGTVNRSEIVKTIQDVFIADYSLKREDLTKEASLGLT
jgi:hypothetical protein